MTKLSAFDCFDGDERESVATSGKTQRYVF